MESIRGGIMNQQSIWEMRSDSGKEAQYLSDELGISVLLARILIQRGIDSPASARKFLWGGLQDLDSPWTLGGMTDAVQRIEGACSNQELIAVYGDYDADGVCSVVVLLQCLREMGCPAVYYVPDRFREGYGLNSAAVTELAEQGCRLLITVDCGINSLEEVALANQLGMDVIISDHHNPGPRLPQALAIINPKLGSCPDSRDLAGVGVAYYLTRALGEKRFTPALYQEWLALVALATVADVVSLLGDNRILVKEGLHSLESTMNPGLKALLKECGLDGQVLNSWHLGFVLAPRLNSAGRLQDARLSIELLLTQEEQRAGQLARQLCRLNDERKIIEQAIVQEAMAFVKSEEEQDAIVLGGVGWHHGVLGIAASRLCDRYRKPVIMLSWEEETARGSARSLEGYNIFAGLESSRSFLQRFGGHSMAAGLSLDRGQFQNFKNSICAWAAEIHTANPELRNKRWVIDAMLDPGDMKVDLVRELELLKPLGEGNPGPVFALRGIELHKCSLVGKDSQHFKACLAGPEIDCIAFNHPDYLDFPHQQSLCDMLGHLDENEFRGRCKLQFKVMDMKASLLPDRSGGQNPTRRRAILTAIMDQLQEKRTVLLVFPTLRVLQREKTWLEGFFRASIVFELHGGCPPAVRAGSAQQLTQARGGIFLTTRAFADHFLSGLPENIERYDAQTPGLGLDTEGLNGQWPGFTIPTGPNRICWEMADWNFPDGQRSLIYANRKATVERVRSEWPNIIVESGLADSRQRHAAYHRFHEQTTGLLLSDGGCIGGLHSNWSVDRVLFADAPFSLTEAELLLANLGSNNQARAGVLFTPDALEANHIYLQRLYPDLTTIRDVWAGLRSMGLPIIEGRPDHLAHQLSIRIKGSIKSLELLSSLQILEDLDLCQLEKKGSIMAINLVKRDHLQIDLSDSAFYLEGMAEKAALATFDDAIKSSLDW
ncbi:MAG TPA: single-stranded-DNA-specific exonuclease RecJ [Syntrophomonadaceae bacterium]|nr:single-stranded-DNA-specific exonuclease RecJ [Syntrophomonadaceae bacterium]